MPSELSMSTPTQTASNIDNDLGRVEPNPSMVLLEAIASAHSVATTQTDDIEMTAAASVEFPDCSFAFSIDAPEPVSPSFSISVRSSRYSFKVRPVFCY